MSLLADPDVMEYFYKHLALLLAKKPPFSPEQLDSLTTKQGDQKMTNLQKYGTVTDAHDAYAADPSLYSHDFATWCDSEAPSELPSWVKIGHLVKFSYYYHWLGDDELHIIDGIKDGEVSISHFPPRKETTPYWQSNEHFLGRCTPFELFIPDWIKIGTTFLWDGRYTGTDQLFTVESIDYLHNFVLQANGGTFVFDPYSIDVFNVRPAPVTPSLPSWIKPGAKFRFHFSNGEMHNKNVYKVLEITPTTLIAERMTESSLGNPGSKAYFGIDSVKALTQVLEPTYPTPKWAVPGAWIAINGDLTRVRKIERLSGSEFDAYGQRMHFTTGTYADMDACYKNSAIRPVKIVPWSPKQAVEFYQSGAKLLNEAGLAHKALYIKVDRDAKHGWYWQAAPTCNGRSMCKDFEQEDHSPCGTPVFAD